MIAGVLSLDESWSTHSLASKLAEASCRYPTLEPRAILNDNRAVCYHIKGRDQHDLEFRAPISKNHDVVVIGELACSKRNQQVLQNEIVSGGIERLFDYSGLW